MKKFNEIKFKDLYPYFNNEHLSFIHHTLRGNSKENKHYLNSACFNSSLSTKNFPKQDIDLCNFDWQRPNMDRNWWWQVQALPFLQWIVTASKDDINFDEKHLLFTISAFEQWSRCNKRAVDSPLMWHDHATAFRLTNITNWLVWISLNEKSRVIFEASSLSEEIPSILQEHVDWLSSDSNYTVNTNHGFDQALSIYTLGLFTKFELNSSDVNLSRKRLLDELNFAFTPEGVHKENSPGYHVFMMRRLEKLIQLSKLGDAEISVAAGKYLRGAEDFLNAVTLPNGFLPMVGDTRGERKGILKNNYPKVITTFDFSKSGYLIIKGEIHGAKFYLLFKASHFATYHKHADDLSLYIHYNGYTVLADGGLGEHNKASENRKFLMSSSAHNVPFIDNINAILNVNRLPASPEVKILGSRIYGKTRCMKGFVVERIIDISNLKNGLISIDDIFSFEDGVDSPVLCKSNFFSELDVKYNKKTISLNKDGVNIAKVHSENIEEDNYYIEDALISHDYLKYSRANSFGFNKTLSTKSICIKTELELC